MKQTITIIILSVLCKENSVMLCCKGEWASTHEKTYWYEWDKSWDPGEKLKEQLDWICGRSNIILVNENLCSFHWSIVPVFAKKIHFLKLLSTTLTCTKQILLINHVPPLDIFCLLSLFVLCRKVDVSGKVKWFLYVFSGLWSFNSTFLLYLAMKPFSWNIYNKPIFKLIF